MMLAMKLPILMKPMTLVQLHLLMKMRLLLMRQVVDTVILYTMASDIHLFLKIELPGKSEQHFMMQQETFLVLTIYLL